MTRRSSSQQSPPVPTDGIEPHGDTDQDDEGPTRFVDLIPTASLTRPRGLGDTHWDFLTGNREKDQDNVRILLDSVEELYGTHALDALLSRAVDRAIRVTGAERGMILLEKDGHLEATLCRNSRGQDLPRDTSYSRTVAERVWQSGAPALALDCKNAEEIDFTKSMEAMALRSVMGVPLPVKGRSLGVLYVDSTAGVRRFADADFSVFQALGGVVALALENARLLQEKEEQDRLHRELLVARHIQERLLPGDIPQPAGFEIAGYGRPCEETSGDYYDVIPFNDHHLALVMGDVSGHGLGPAMLMASSCALVHTALLTRSSPADAMCDVNAFLESYTPPETFMTMCLGSLDPIARELRYVRAGHEFPLLLHANGELEELTEGSCALGVRPDAPYRLTPPQSLESGSALLLYTDGIYEAADDVGDRYGEKRFRDSFVRHARRGCCAQAIVESIVADLEAFVRGSPLEDDVTLLVVRTL